MNKWIQRFCFIVIVFFALIGAFFISIVFHELSHRQDLEKYVTDDGELCFFAFPGNASLKEIIFSDYAAGYFMYKFKNDTANETKSNIESYTENKAYAIGILIIIILFICIMVDVITRVQTSNAIEFYSFFNKWVEQNHR